jgi:putative chitinase
LKHIKLYQEQNGLKPDGVIGPITYRSMMNKWKMSREELAHFLGQTHHETGGFVVEEENLNYSAKRLIEVFKNKFDVNKDKWLSEQEKQKVYELVGNPERIANFVYANKNGNSNEASGDGWKYRGRGSIQLTGKENYFYFAKSVNDFQIMDKPNIINECYYFEVGLWYFNRRNIKVYSKTVSLDTILRVTYLVNGGENGLRERVDKTKQYYDILKWK